MPLLPRITAAHVRATLMPHGRAQTHSESVAITEAFEAAHPGVIAHLREILRGSTFTAAERTLFMSGFLLGADSAEAALRAQVASIIESSTEAQ